MTFYEDIILYLHHNPDGIPHLHVTYQGQESIISRTATSPEQIAQLLGVVDFMRAFRPGRNKEEHEDGGE